MKKLLALLMVLAMTVACFASCGKNDDSTGDSTGPSQSTGDSQSTGGDTSFPTDGRVYNDFKVGGQAIIGSSTELSGDFRWPALGGSSAGAADQDVVKLTSGYATMDVDQHGSYVWNATAVESHNGEEIDHGDGTLTYKMTIKIKSGLKLSDGSEVTADNYLAYPLAMSTPVSKAGVNYNRSGYSFVGWDTYVKYDGTNESAEGVTKGFSGIRKIDAYTFSIEVNSENYPYYFVDTLGAFSCYDVKLVLGDGVEVKDDGEGAYLSSAWYEKANGEYTKAAHLKAAKDDVSKYAFSGPYTISKWDKSNKEATLKINPQFAGNFEGQKPHVETIIYRKVVEETQFAQLESGEVDILSALTGADPVNSALALEKKGKFKNVYYDRAGYGKVQFDCDFGPTLFTEVRQAVAYCLDREKFANTFCGGYGTVVHGPYSVNFDAYLNNQDYLEENLNTYAISAAKAKQVLVDGGWVYKADGTPYDGKGIRYKKLTAAEAAVEANTKFKTVSNSSSNFADIAKDGYKTEKVGDDYYMPCVINWFGTTPNPVTEQLNTALIQGTMLYECGVGLTLTTGDFTSLLANIYRDGEAYGGTPVYGMYNLATGWNVAVYDYSYQWIDDSNKEMYDAFFEYSTNKLSDPYDKTFSWWTTENQGLSYADAVKKSGGKLGMNYLSFAMVYSTKVGDTEEYDKWFAAYMLRWNELIPDIPLYGNIYYDCYNAKILNFKTSPFFGAADALLYCGIDSAQ
ncbi:MAG: ABC transporter substrate-binding protein [Clostridiales bacterium]|nr:ABC transporter substrate-binding protein [Clostridiales bacterium]